MHELVMDELIGREVRVVKSTRRDLIGIQGIIVDETLNNFELETNSKTRIVPKKLCVFAFVSNEKEVLIDGRDLVCRPEDRIKKYWRKFDARMRRQKMSKARRA